VSELIRVAFHIHTNYSPDSRTTIEQVIDKAISCGIKKIAITDHNTIRGALHMKRLYPEMVIVGEEIMTSEGEIIGLFLSKLIPRDMTPEQTLSEIHAQGGLSYIPHPFDYKRAHFTVKRIRELAHMIDIIEIFNPKCSPECNNLASQIANELGIACAVGCDAHYAEDICKYTMLIEDFASPVELLFALKNSQTNLELRTS
jgi:predicted metal-dependent phosphoesterase TrpH